MTAPRPICIQCCRNYRIPDRMRCADCQAQLDRRHDHAKKT
jgi:hypothetical protein